MQLMGCARCAGTGSAPTRVHTLQLLFQALFACYHTVTTSSAPPAPPASSRPLLLSPRYLSTCRAVLGNLLPHLQLHPSSAQAPPPCSPAPAIAPLLRTGRRSRPPSECPAGPIFSDALRALARRRRAAPSDAPPPKRAKE